MEEDDGAVPASQLRRLRPGRDVSRAQRVRKGPAVVREACQRDAGQRSGAGWTRAGEGGRKAMIIVSDGLRLLIVSSVIALLVAASRAQTQPSVAPADAQRALELSQQAEKVWREGRFNDAADLFRQ